jgi:hypothetical protein
MRPVYRGPVPENITFTGRLQKQAPEEYAFFRRSLVHQLGEYCSFCEVPLGANLAIEHIVSKSGNSNLENNWDNFILACTNCNSTKGTRVNHSNLSQYYFPSDTTISTFKKLKYDFDVNDNMVKVEAADIRDERANKTIELTALNRTRATDLKVSDRRVVNRTAAWSVANELATCLEGYYTRLGAAANNDPGAQLLKEQIKAAAIARGFWSVWMTVFGSKIFVNDAIRDDLLHELFVVTFPGTNYPLGAARSVVSPAYSGGLPK